MKIKVAVSGALGNMGKEVIRAVTADADLELVAAIDTNGDNTSDIGPIAHIGETNIPVNNDMAKTLREIKPDVVVDFTSPYTVMQNVETIMAAGVRPVVGTTGITEADLEKIKGWSEKYGVSGIIAPNFAIGAVLMMLFAAQAAKYLPDAEIIELHHDKKVDAPSGTAIKTAEMILKSRGRSGREAREELEKVKGARGGEMDGVNLHSVRLPGLVAHQEVLFGGIGQTLSIRHDSIDRTSFMPGVVLAVKEVMKKEEVIYGLENILNL
ncbi:4-hydroxy-tetrahydrodipicolinate reductase [Dethiobacter alkaliphilus]|uniref:4-hydroxy-tetrahydrodipicolinate reductase n=1 Tax=Dethiobacter alkaliphilus AHT 1 TaxID=555088 RepID=C0GGI1_DETAL|nr:4-hydroxy-tetrahydrodipicolinate reductase [Dethiobacter alkaliphilus]EEG77422.1 Dihydrodipicolinate reductase [Dethiobacter alkaliphilus AHT 1]